MCRIPGAPATLYSGAHLGVYRCTDGGVTWARFGSGLPLVRLHADARVDVWPGFCELTP